jgi:hypothetical protein
LYPSATAAAIEDPFEARSALDTVKVEDPDQIVATGD